VWYIVVEFSEAIYSFSPSKSEVFDTFSDFENSWLSPADIFALSFIEAGKIEIY